MRPFVILFILLFLFSIYLILIMTRTGKRPDIRRLYNYSFAHRGFHDKGINYPENSLSAFRRALFRGYAIELDVRLSADHELMVFHDSSLQRICHINRYLREMTSAELEAQARLCNTLEHIPTLQQVLELVNGKVPLLIELKSDSKTYKLLTAKTVALLRGYSGIYVLQSFDPRILSYLRRHYPEICRGQLTTNFHKTEAKLNPISSFFMTTMITNVIARPDFIACDIRHRKRFGLWLCRILFNTPEFSWTVTNSSQQKEMKQLGNIIIFENFDA